MARKRKSKSAKKARYIAEPTVAKKPHWIGPPTLEGKHITWRFGHAEMAGPWSWPSTTDAQLRRIVTKLPQFETMLHSHGIKDVRSIVPFSKLSKPARDRLQAIARDDAEDYYAWHISGKERLWCIEYAGMMCVLWWDPEHQVYTTDKKHT